MQTAGFLEDRAPLDLWAASQRVNVTTWRRGNVHRVEVTAKDGDQVRWFGTQVEAPPSLSQVLAVCEAHGEILVRPFALGAPFDAAAWPCIAALVRHCLTRLGADVLDIVRPATTEEVIVTSGALARAAAVGEWQGVVYPKAWRTAEVQRLCAYLRDACGLSALASRIEALQAEPPPAEVPF
jgi:hypothetical protein